MPFATTESNSQQQSLSRDMAGVLVGDLPQYERRKQYNRMFVWNWYGRYKNYLMVYCCVGVGVWFILMMSTTTTTGITLAPKVWMMSKTWNWQHKFFMVHHPFLPHACHSDHTANELLWWLVECELTRGQFISYDVDHSIHCFVYFYLYPYKCPDSFVTFTIFLRVEYDKLSYFTYKC